MCLTIKLYKDGSFLEVNNSRHTEKKGRTMSANPSSTKAPSRKKARTKESESSGKSASMTEFKGKSDFPAPTRTESAAAVEPEPDMEADEPAVPGGTGAMMVPNPPGGAVGARNGVGNVAANADNKTLVPEVVGPPIGQQIAVLTVQVQPQKFNDVYAGGLDWRQAPELWRCPPHTPVFTSRSVMTTKVSDGVPRVMSYVANGLDANIAAGAGDDLIFVGVSLEDGIADTADQIRHYKNNGKGRFTVATNGVVTVNVSPKNLRDERFTYGDPFCLAGNGAGVYFSAEFEGRLRGQRTFTFSRYGKRIGTFIKALSGPTGGVGCPPPPFPQLSFPWNYVLSSTLGTAILFANGRHSVSLFRSPRQFGGYRHRLPFCRGRLDNLERVRINKKDLWLGRLEFGAFGRQSTLELVSCKRPGRLVLSSTRDADIHWHPRFQSSSISKPNTWKLRKRLDRNEWEWGSGAERCGGADTPKPQSIPKRVEKRVTQDGYWWVGIEGVVERNWCLWKCYRPPSLIPSVSE